MSVISAMVGRPAPLATSAMLDGQLARLGQGGHERAVARLHVHREALQSGGELLGQDRRGDQRHALDRGGDVADAVEPLVGRCEVGGLADDRAADLGRDRCGTWPSWARRRSRGSTPSCRTCRRCGRGRGRRSSARSRRTRRPSGRASGSPCRRRRPWSACRAPARRGPSAARRRCRASPVVSATASAVVMPLK